MDGDERRDGSRWCEWCGSVLLTGGGGRPRRYCGRSCRQRAYERRRSIERGGLPPDMVVLSTTELADLHDRVFQLRCAAEDVATATSDGADGDELLAMARELARAARGLEKIR